MRIMRSMEARLNREGRNRSRASSCPSGLGGEIFVSFWNRQFVVSDQMMLVVLVVRGESCLFFSFFIDYLIVSHSSGPAGQKVAIRMGEGKREEGRRKKIKKRKRKKETWREISNFFNWNSPFTFVRNRWGEWSLVFSLEYPGVRNLPWINNRFTCQYDSKKSKMSRNPLQKSPSRWTKVTKRLGNPNS